MDKRHYMLDEWIKILKGKWKGDYTHLAIYDYGKAAHWRYDECPLLPEQCFSNGEFEARLAEIEKENNMNESTLAQREEMSYLDWLARNVHVWKDGCKFVYILCSAQGVFAMWLYDKDSVCQSNTFTRQQWLARRAELQNKPAEWPIGVNWLAQDKDGEWHFYTDGIDNPPQNHGEDNWYSDDVVVRCRLVGEVLGDWRDTLEKRPETNEMPSHSNRPKPSTDIPECAEVKKLEPFVSVEDAKITILQSDGDVKNFGGIIGRNLLPEEDAATAKQPAPKGSGNPILGMVLADLTNRALEGKEKYGEPLLAHNGRNPLWDAYQEALDLAMYLRQAIEERK